MSTCQTSLAFETTQADGKRTQYQQYGHSQPRSRLRPTTIDGSPGSPPLTPELAVACSPMAHELSTSREKALLDPTRLKMVLQLSIPRTVKQVADRLGISYRRLYHHMQVLEDAGVVEQV